MFSSPLLLVQGCVLCVLLAVESFVGRVFLMWFLSVLPGGLVPSEWQWVK